MGYLVLPGTAGNYASAPDLAAYTPTDLDWRAALALTDWTPFDPTSLFGKIQDTSNREHRMEMQTGSGGLFRGHFNHTDGTAGNEVASNSTAAPTITDGDWLGLRFTVDSDNGAAGNDFKFYTKADAADLTAIDDNTGWVQLGTTVTNVTARTIWDGPSVIEIGSAFLGTIQLAEMKVGAVQLKDGINGTAVFSADFSDLTVDSGVDGETFTEESSNAATVTIHGTGWSYVDAAVSGTVVTGGVLESEIVSGGETIILTLTEDTWVATVGDDNAITQALIDGIDSAESEAAGWDAVVKANMVFGDVVRTSDTVVTITLAAEAAYSITADETITATIPATALSGGAVLVGSPTFVVTNETPPIGAPPITRRVISSPRYGITRSASR